VHLANCDPTLSALHIFHEVDESDRAGFQSGVIRADGSNRDAASSLADALAADGGACSGGVWRTLGTFLYPSTAVVPEYTSFPYAGAKPYAATTTSGGGRYVTLDAGEGFTYAITFRNGSHSASVAGSAPKTTATVKAPVGFGAGTATIVLKAEANPARSSTVTLSLGGKPKKRR